MKFLVLTFAGILSMSTVAAKSHFASDIERTQDKKSKASVLILYKQPILEAQSKLLRNFGATVHQLFSFPGIVKVATLFKNGQARSESPEIQYIAPDRKLRRSLDYGAAVSRLTTAFCADWTGAGVV